MAPRQYQCRRLVRNVVGLGVDAESKNLKPRWSLSQGAPRHGKTYSRECLYRVDVIPFTRPSPQASIH